MNTPLRNITILAITLVVVVISSCKKEDNVKTATEYLTGGNWTITAMTIDPGIDLGNGTIITDVYAESMDQCDKDNLMKFNTDGTITGDEGIVKCDDNDPQTSDLGIWTISEDGKTITFASPDEDPVVSTVEVLNGTTFKWFNKIEGPDTQGNGTITHTQTVTMILQ